MIQILGLNDTGHIHFEKGLRAPSVRELLANPEKYLEGLSEEERVNVYFTVHACKGDSPRDFIFQDVLPFDIDNIDPEKAEDTAKVVCEALGVNFSQTGVLFSGHGLQLFISLEKKIEDPKFFSEYRDLYKLVCQKITGALKKAGLKGEVDTSVFSPKRLMRMPETWNSKPHKGPDKWARVIQPTMEAQGFLLEEACGAPRLSRRDSIHKDAWAKFPDPDVKGVQEGCEFLKWAKEKQKDLSEPQWYAMLGLVSFLPGWEKLVHEYSKEHPLYTYEETDFKARQARNVTGPRTCDNISKHWDGCSTCPYFGKCTTPLQIQGEDFISTESTGFYKSTWTDSGKARMVPDYAGLCKYFKREKGPYFSCSDSEGFYVYSKDKKHWYEMTPLDLCGFAYKAFNPEPRSHITNEWERTIKVMFPRSSRWMDETTKKKLNLQNGIYDIEKDKLLPHSEAYGFLGVLPYEYNDKAKAPVFMRFLNEIACGDKEIVNLLLEFMGYAISGDENWIHKSLVLLGEGSNGKSTFCKILKALVGEGNYSSLSIKGLTNDQNRALLDGKLFNVGDENEPEDMLSSDVLKGLIAGEEYIIKEVYKKPMQRKCRTKFIFNCNELPKIKDKSEGMFRRLLIVPFNAMFSHEKGNIDPDIDAKLLSERPGILNLCLEGYRRVKERGKLIEPEESSQILSEMREDLDDFSEWFETCVQVTGQDTDYAGKNELYSNYKQRLDLRHIRYPMTRVWFFRKLRTKLGTIKERRLRDEGSRERGYIGLKLKSKF